MVGAPRDSVLRWTVPSPAGGLAFDPRGRHLVSAHADRLVVWLIGAEEPMCSIAALPERTGYFHSDRYRVGFFSDDKVFVSLADEEVGAWDLKSGRTVEWPASGRLFAVSRDGNRALTIPRGTHRVSPAPATVWDLPTGERIGDLGSGESELPIWNGALSSDGRVAVLARDVPDAPVRTDEHIGRLEAWEVNRGVRLRDDLLAKFPWRRTPLLELSPSGASTLADVHNPPRRRFPPPPGATCLPLDERQRVSEIATRADFAAFLDEERIAIVHSRTGFGQGLDLWVWRREEKPTCYRRLSSADLGLGSDRKPQVRAIAASPTAPILAIADDRRCIAIWDFSQDP